MEKLLAQILPVFRYIGVIAAGVLIGYAAYGLLRRPINRLVIRSSNEFWLKAFNEADSPLRLMAVLFFVYLTLPLIGQVQGESILIWQVLSIALIGSIAWMMIRGTVIAEIWLKLKRSPVVTDDLVGRRLLTQMTIIRRVLAVVIAVVAFASALMVFDRVRQLGTSILASAGIAGIIVGLAAQKTIANLLAGLQLAITQPIRLDDVVVIEGEFGRVEEITMTYVVIRLWNLRRLIVPLAQFIEKPFQNWTRISPEVIGSVFLCADYSINVETLRGKLRSFLAETPLWDGKVWGLQVTNATDKGLEIRALMSAKDAGSLWDLRCHIRERMIVYLQ
ncbi:MAG: mechanosensitive ion channel domain-containing protein [Thermodesulfobacteriota bacterium]